MGRGIKVTAKKGTIADVGSTINLENTFGKLPQESPNFLTALGNEGKSVSLLTSGGYTNNYPFDSFAIAKLAIVRFIMSLGADHDLIAAGHSSIRSLYNAIAGNAYTDSNFDENDLMKRFIVIANVDMAMKEIERIMKIYNHTSLINPVVGKYLITSMGLDYDKLAEEAELIPAAFLKLIRSRNQLVLPVGIKIFDEMMSLVKSIYADDLHEKSSLLLFQPEGYYLELGTDSDSNIDCVKFMPHAGLFPNNQGVLYAISRLTAYCEQLLNDASYQLDIAPKLNRAYVEPSGLKLGPVYYWDESETKSLFSDSTELDVTFDEDVLYMIRNASFAGRVNQSLVNAGYGYFKPIIYAKTILSASTGYVTALVQGFIHRPGLSDIDGLLCQRNASGHSTVSGVRTLFSASSNTKLTVDPGEFPATGEKLQKCVSYAAFGDSTAIEYELNTTDYGLTRVVFSGPILFTTFDVYYVTNNNSGQQTDYVAQIVSINRVNSTDAGPGFANTGELNRLRIALEGLTHKPIMYVCDSGQTATVTRLLASPDVDNLLLVPFDYYKTAYLDYLYQAFYVPYAKSSK